MNDASGEEKSLQILPRGPGAWTVEHRPSVKRLPRRAQKPLISYSIEYSLAALLISPLILLIGLVMLFSLGDELMGIKLLVAGALGFLIALMEHYHYYRIMPSWLGGRMEIDGEEFFLEIWGRKKALQRELKGEVQNLRVEFWPPLKGEETGLARFFHQRKLATLELLNEEERERLKSFLEERGVETSLKGWGKG